MTAGQPWSVKGIDPKAREAAKDLARRSGMTLGEWLNQVILEDGVAEEPIAPVTRAWQEPVAKPVYRRAEAPLHANDEMLRVTEALDQLASRIEAAEDRTAQIVGGVDQTVAALVSRLDGAERENTIIAARFEGVAEEIRTEQGRLTERVHQVVQQNAEPGSAEALRTIEGTVAKIASHLYASEADTREALATLRDDLDLASNRLEAVPDDNASLVEHVVARIAERLDQAEARTTSAIHGLETSFGHLDIRLGAAESRLAEQAAGGGLEQIAAKLSADVEAARADMAEKIQAAADGRLDRVEQALQEMTGHVQTAERRSADAVERMGHEVLRMAEVLTRQVQAVERRSTTAIEQVGGDVARIADTMEARFNRADAVGAQALEKLGAEIARITERLAERIGNAERRSAQAIDDVGDQVARVTERLQDRQERAATDLADRIRQSEERTARLLEDARQRIDQRLEETQRRSVESDAFRPAAPHQTPAAEAEAHPFGHRGADAFEPMFGEPAFGEPTETEPAFHEPAFLEPALQEEELEAASFEDSELNAPEFREPDLGEPAFGPDGFEETEAREPDLTEPAPMNFVAERFEEPGPILFQPGWIDAPAPHAFTAQSFVEDGSAEESFLDDTHELDSLDAETLEPRSFEAHAFEDESLDEEPLEDEAFSPTAFALSRFEIERSAESSMFDEAEPLDEADPFDDALEPAAKSDGFGGPPLIEPLDIAASREDHVAEYPSLEPRFESSDDEPLPFGQAAADEPAAPHRAMTTRELIEQARAAARAAALAADPKARKAAAKSGGESGGFSLGGLSLGLSKKPKRRNSSALGAALMISGGAAVLSVGAAGYILLADHPSGALPTRFMTALGMPQTASRPHAAPSAAVASPAQVDPMAAVALSPQTSDEAAAAQASPKANAIATDSGAELYGDAVRRIEARDFTGLDGLRKAANLGYAPAEFYLAKLFETGEAGLKKDLGEARRWTERAAEAGDRKAMHNLALYYVEGSGGPKNTTTAAQWFRRAADLGLVDSQYNLGRLYEEGFGVSQNPAEAYKWYLIAAHAGDTESRASAQRLKGQLSAEAQAAAERAAGAFQAQNPRPATTQLAQATTGGDVAGAAIAQRALSRLGYYQGPTDGSPSPALKGAVAAYQRDQGLPATGVPDSALSQRLAVIAQ